MVWPTASLNCGSHLPLSQIQGSREMVPPYLIWCDRNSLVWSFHWSLLVRKVQKTGRADPSLFYIWLMWTAGPPMVKPQAGELAHLSGAEPQETAVFRSSLPPVVQMWAHSPDRSHQTDRQLGNGPSMVQIISMCHPVMDSIKTLDFEVMGHQGWGPPYRDLTLRRWPTPLEVRKHIVLFLHT